MANLSREQEAVNAYHMKHQLNCVRTDLSCPECRRIPIKEKLDRDKEWDGYARTNGLRTVAEIEATKTKLETNSKDIGG